EGLHYPKNINEILPLVGLALVSQILGQGLLSYCIGKIDITLSSVLVLSQPIIAALYSYFIFRENLTFQEIFGILIVLIGIYLAKIGNNN
ncbi:MAG: EamA family transporter, partial [Cetobacterium sp.]